jgi:hypothetical protein
MITFATCSVAQVVNYSLVVVSIVPLMVAPLLLIVGQDHIYTTPLPSL